MRVITDSWVMTAMIRSAPRRQKGHVAISRPKTRPSSLAQDANGDLVSTFTHPWSDGTTGIRIAPVALVEKLAALVPLPHVHLVRYGGCLAPHSYLRGVIRPTLRQQGLDGEEAPPRTPYWPWAKLLGRVCGLEMATCPLCRRGALRIIAVITQESVITRILRHLQLASVPPPIAPARVRQEIFTFDEAHASVVLSATCAPQRPLACLCACACPGAILPPRLPAVPRLSPQGYPGDAPQTSPAR